VTSSQADHDRRKRTQAPPILGLLNEARGSPMKHRHLDVSDGHWSVAVVDSILERGGASDGGAAHLR